MFNFNKLTVFLLLGLAGLFFTGCGKDVEAGHEGVMVKKPFFGEGGVDETPLEPGFHSLAPTTDLIQVKMLPVQTKEVFDDLITRDNNPVDFDVYITYQIQKGKSPIIIKNFGENWYSINLSSQIRNIVRNNAKTYTMFELTTNPVVSEKIERELETSITKYVSKKNIPVNIINIAIGKVNPPREVIDETAKTAAQVQRVKTETERVKAEQARILAEKAKGEADLSYIKNSGITVDQYIRMREIELLKENRNVTVIMGNGGVVLPTR